MRTRMHVLATTAAVGLLLAGCDPTSTVNTTAANTTASTSSSHGAASAAAKKAGLGSTIDVTNTSGQQLALTLVKVVPNAQGADQFTSPSAGKVFYAVQVRIVNASKTAFSDAPDNCMVVKDAAGQSFQTDLSSVTAGPGFGSVNLAAGDQALGFEVFQVPSGDKITEVQFTTDSGMGPGTAQWQVG